MIGKALLDGLRPYTFKKCALCPPGTAPPTFHPMYHSQLVHDDNAVLEPDDIPRNIVADGNGLGQNYDNQPPTLRHVCMTYIPILTNIPLPVWPDVAEFSNAR